MYYLFGNNFSICKIDLILSEFDLNLSYILHFAENVFGEVIFTGITFVPGY